MLALAEEPVQGIESEHLINEFVIRNEVEEETLEEAESAPLPDFEKRFSVLFYYLSCTSVNL